MLSRNGFPTKMVVIQLIYHILTPCTLICLLLKSLGLCCLFKGSQLALSVVRVQMRKPFASDALLSIKPQRGTCHKQLNEN